MRHPPVKLHVAPCIVSQLPLSMPVSSAACSQNWWLHVKMLHPIKKTKPEAKMKTCSQAWGADPLLPTEHRLQTRGANKYHHCHLPAKVTV